MLFSERIGATRAKDVIQVQSMDGDLRIGLWNVLTEVYWTPNVITVGYGIHAYYGTRLQHDFEAAWRDFFKLPTDTLTKRWYDLHKQIREWYFGWTWFKVYDFVEHVAGHFGEPVARRMFVTGCNSVLKRELSAYRLVGGRVVQITAEEEIAAIDQAVNNTNALTPVRVHLETALGLLAEKEKEPDYRNSIKESISAVESLASLLVGQDKAELSRALEEIERRTGKFHGAFKKGINGLYGYTCDAQGIRHGLLEEPSLDLEDAQFMLVLCSSLVNYLIQKAGKAGIKVA